MNDSSNYSIVRREPQHVDQLNKMYADVFGAELYDKSLKRWNWQYLDNPGIGKSEPAIWVAVQGDVVLGQLATMEFPMWWGDHEVQASAAMDYMVRNEARGRGIGIALTEAWLDHVDVGLGLGLTPSSYALFRKTMTDVGPVPSYLRILDSKMFARHRLGWFLGTITAPFLKMALHFTVSPAAQETNLNVRMVSDFSKDYDDLWLRVRGSYAAIVRRDSNYLNWKYIRCPFRSYRIYEARTAEMLSGYIVTRTEGDPSFQRGIIVDLFCDPQDTATTAALVEIAMNNFQSIGVARVETYCLDTRLIHSFKQLGFRAGRTTTQYCVSHRRISSAPLTRQSEWNLMLGDGDLDRA